MNIISESLCGGGGFLVEVKRTALARRIASHLGAIGISKPCGFSVVRATAMEGWVSLLRGSSHTVSLLTSDHDLVAAFYLQIYVAPVRHARGKEIIYNHFDCTEPTNCN